MAGTAGHPTKTRHPTKTGQPALRAGRTAFPRPLPPRSIRSPVMMWILTAPSSEPGISSTRAVPGYGAAPPWRSIILSTRLPAPPKACWRSWNRPPRLPPLPRGRRPGGRGLPLPQGRDPLGDSGSEGQARPAPLLRGQPGPVPVVPADCPTAHTNKRTIRRSARYEAAYRSSISSGERL